jgi:cob(I)alamin adenosyltransferase
MRITKVTTKKGDQGETELSNGKRVSKAHPRIQCLGALDELSCHLGLVFSIAPEGLQKTIHHIQNDILNLGGELSSPQQEKVLLQEERVTEIEAQIQRLNRDLPPLKEFLLPGGSEVPARLHLARAVCRRAEREVVALLERETGRKLWVQYLNRLSDLLFVLARSQQQEQGGGSEPQWHRSP